MPAPTSKPKVLVTSRLPSVAIEPLRHATDLDYRNEAGPIPRDELLQRVRDIDGLVAPLTDKVDEELFAAAPRLKVVANVSVGYNNTDVAAAIKRGVMITNTPDVLTDATADLTLGLILGITRRLMEGDRLIRRGGWKGGFGLDFMLGTDLRGKRLGILGMGRIGQAVAKRAVSFGMEIAYSPSPRQKPGAGTQGLRTQFDGFTATPLILDELLGSSDIVSIHVPLTSETRHLIDQKKLARMRRSAYLINVARGPVVDEAALAWALREGVISGAGLDVFEKEPEVHADLMPLENVVLVPHLGSATRETRTRMAELAVSNCLNVVLGKPPLTPIPELKDGVKQADAASQRR
jgi:glyoxylate reductase